MIDIDDKKRRALEELLPFYANGTLEGAELAEVETAVAQDSDLAWELEHLQLIRADVKARAVAQTPGEFGLSRLMREIDAETVQPVQKAANTNTRIWQFAAAAAIAVLAVQTTVMFSTPDTPGYELASGGSGVGYDGPILTVAFHGTATEGEIRALLLSLDLEFISGPSALGLYEIGALDEASAEAALTELGAATTLVESVEKE